jgi:hypothetical protein
LDRGKDLHKLAPSQLALDGAVDLQVFDRGCAVTESSLGAGGHDLLAPRLGLLARVPDLNDPYLAVFADRGYVK